MQPTTPRLAADRPDRGFSLIESMIAMVLMLMISLSILPMFTRSMTAANSGREKTDVTTFLRIADELLAMPLGEGQMVPQTGEKTRETIFFWCQGDSRVVADADEGWFDDPESRGLVLWDRRTSTRQYSVRSLDADLEGRSDLDEEEAIAGGDSLENVHWTVTEVLLDGRRKAGPLGPGVLMSARQIRAF